MPLKVGMIGLGAIAQEHACAIRETKDLQLALATDLNKKRCRDFCKMHNVTACPSWESMLDSALDLIVITLPHGLHSSYTIAALEAGSNVLVEKPMAGSAVDCMEMLKVAQRCGRYLGVSESGTFHPGAIRTGNAFAAGNMGKFCSGSFTNIRYYFTEERPEWFFDPQMSGGGMFANVGLHREK